MNYYGPKQRVQDGRWDYTRNSIPQGYCCEYNLIDEQHFHTAHKHHMSGHDTKQEACECYREYLLDHKLILNKKMHNQQRRCEICQEWTQGFAEIDSQLFLLCNKHNNRESVETLFKSPSESWSSW